VRLITTKWLEKAGSLRTIHLRILLEWKRSEERRRTKGYERPRIASQTRKIDATGEKDGTKGGEILSRNTIIAIIVLIIGVFMLLYSHSSFSRKKTG
jgi:hypothetical protein